METQLADFCLYFFERFAAQITNLHHVFRGLIDQLFNRVDTSTLQAVVRTNRELKLIDAHLQYLFLLVIFLLYHNLCGLGILRKIDEQAQVLAEYLRSQTDSLIGSQCVKADGYKVALLDFGAKNNIAQSLHKRGCEVTIYPAHTTAEEILSSDPDGIMLSNGPGDPKACTDIIKEVKKLYDSEVPIFAICLGHQLMALATGADTYKLKYGHRGGNHPVKDLETGRVYISSQNHGYAVDADSLDQAVAVPAFTNVNDGTNEGLKYTGKNIFTVQFHPEACPGPQDSGYLFDKFIEMMGGQK